MNPIQLPALITLALSLASAGLRAQEKTPDFQVPDTVAFRSANIISEGTRMGAEVFAPKDATEKLPAVIMSHGWGGTAESLRADAVLFAEAGYLVVTFDYRGWGNSDARLIAKGKAAQKDGKLIAEVAEVRGVVDPIDQTTEIMNALHWVKHEKLNEQLGRRDFLKKATQAAANRGGTFLNFTERMGLVAQSGN